MKNLLFILAITISYQSFGQSPSLPIWFSQAYTQDKLSEKYDIKTNLKPAYLYADFNGDGVKDIAVMVIEKTKHKKGIVLIYGKSKKWIVFGAGNKLGKAGFDESDDLKWIEGWEVYKKKIAYETKFDNGDIVGSIKRTLLNNAISIWSLEDGAPLAGGLITWDGKKYLWIHQGE